MAELKTRKTRSDAKGVLTERVERCLANKGDLKVTPLVGEPMCAMGTRMPCGYQGRSFERMIKGEGTGVSVFPCFFMPGQPYHQAQSPDEAYKPHRLGA